MIGNKAVHEEDNLAYNAGQAYHLLSQEIYTFANDFTGKKKKPLPRQREDISREDASSREQLSRPSRGSASRSRGAVSRAGGSSSARRRRPRSSGPVIDPGSLLKIFIPIAIIIILIFIIRLVHPGDENGAETTAPIELETIAPTEEATTEENTTEAAPAKRYRTSDTLNVRSEPSTSASKLGQLAPGTEVEYIEDYDDTWVKITFEGQEGYVSKEYLELIAE